MYELFSGRLDEQLLVKVVKDKLMSNPCTNQGFVLDGFPKTYKQAQELFSGDTLTERHSVFLLLNTTINVYIYIFFFVADEYESEDGTSSYKNIKPGFNIMSNSYKHCYSVFSVVALVIISLCSAEFVLFLDAPDAFLKDRVINLPERLVQEHKYEYFHFVQRLARYRTKPVEDETVVNYFEELDINSLYLGNSHFKIVYYKMLKGFNSGF